ncbi:MAG: thiol peroxidase [Candidatus Rokubacteria bacterium]|nr:thiol peroxidase [Candidatus Rokubacteria bacterium]
MSTRTVKMRGTPLPVAGPELRAGDRAPDFKLHQRGPEGLRDVSLRDFAGKTLVLSVVPSLDTPVCEAQTKRFNEEAARLPASVAVLTVSMDLPFAQARFCGEKGIDRVQAASDHRDAGFGRDYGTLIEPLRLEARALFVVGGDGHLKHVEYVPEVTEHPDYDAALAAARRG